MKVKWQLTEYRKRIILYWGAVALVAVYAIAGIATRILSGFCPWKKYAGSANHNHSRNIHPLLHDRSFT